MLCGPTDSLDERFTETNYLCQFGRYRRRFSRKLCKLTRLPRIRGFPAWAHEKRLHPEGCPRFVLVEAPDHFRRTADVLHADLTGLLCTSRREREFTRRTAGYAEQEVRGGTDRNVATPD